MIVHTLILFGSIGCDCYIGPTFVINCELIKKYELQIISSWSNLFKQVPARIGLIELTYKVATSALLCMYRPNMSTR